MAVNSIFYSLRGRVAETKGMTTDEALEMFTKRQPTGRFCTAQEVSSVNFLRFF